jgi:hypothetical protein
VEHVARMGEVGNAHKIFLLENLGLDGKVVLEWMLGKCARRYGMVDLAEDRDHWRAVVNTVMNLRVL